MAAKWFAPGFDSDDLGLANWLGTNIPTNATLAQDTSVKYSGRGSVKVNTGTMTAATTGPYTGSPAVMPTNGRLSFYFRTTGIGTGTVSAKPVVIMGLQNGAFEFGICTGNDGKLAITKNVNAGSVTADVVGSTVLAASTWYRICVCWSITSASVNSIKVYLASDPSMASPGTPEITATNLTLNSTATNIAVFGIVTCTTAGDMGASKVANFQHMYVDDDTSGMDVGNVHVTAKLPASNNTNTFNTPVGANPANRWNNVDERPTTTTNGWGATASSETENYGIQNAATGDEAIGATDTQLAYFGWMLAIQTAGAATTALQVNGSNITVTIGTTVGIYWGGTTLNTPTTSSTYPSNAATIGLTYTTGSVTVVLYECGIVLAFLKGAAESLADSGTLTESTSTAAAITQADSGTETDAATTAAAITASDSATATETMTIVISVSMADSGTLAEALALAAALAAADTATLSQALTLAAAVSSSDSASLSETESITSALSISDSATVADTTSAAITIMQSDSGTLAETLSAPAAVPLADSATLAQTLTTAASAAMTDSATFAETMLAGTAVPMADAATESDSMAAVAAIGQADAATLTESVSTAAALSVSDSGAAADTMNVAQGTPITMADAATLAQSLTSTAALSVTESGALTESVATTAALSVSDSGTEADSMTASNAAAVSMSDAGTLAESTSTAASLFETDGGTATEALTTTSALAFSDSAAMVDLVAIAATAPALSDSAGVSESLTRSILQQLVDTFHLSESVLVQMIAVGAAGHVTVGDGLVNWATVADGLTFQDEAEDTVTNTASVADALT